MALRKKSILIGIILAMMFLPFIQNRLVLITEKPLFGKNYSVIQPQFSFRNWMNATYQDSLQIYISSTVGFQGSLMRLKNQIAFSFFYKAKANGIIVGKNGCLFDRSQIRAWTGDDFAGHEKIYKMMKSFKEIQDGFALGGKKLVWIMISGKGYYFPEFIPGSPGEGKITNYKLIREFADSLGINFLDLSSWARKLKKTNLAPLYNMNGLHLTEYGNVMIMDTLINYLERVMNKDLPEILIQSVNWQVLDDPRENDIAKGMNLIFDQNPEKLAYPVYRVEGPHPEINTLIIGDSYASGMFYSDIWGRSFKESDFLFYFRELQRRGGPGIPGIPKNVIGEVVNNKELILFIVSDGNLPELGWGSVESAAKIFSEPLIRKERKKLHEERIRANEEWMNIEKKKSEEKGITLDSMIRLDAIYLYEEEKSNFLAPRNFPVGSK